MMQDVLQCRKRSEIELDALRFCVTEEPEFCNMTCESAIVQTSHYTLFY